jgi:hypothetical protein
MVQRTRSRNHQIERRPSLSTRPEPPTPRRRRRQRRAGALHHLTRLDCGFSGLHSLSTPRSTASPGGERCLGDHAARAWRQFNGLTRFIESRARNRFNADCPAGGVMTRSAGFGWSRLCAALCALLAVGAAICGPAEASASHRCLAGDLQLISVRWHETGAVAYWDFALRNVGARACHLRGYPRVHLLGRHGRQLSDRFVRITTARVRIVTLRHRRLAFFTIVYAPGTRCGVDHYFAYGLTAVPPGATRRLTVPRRRFSLCDAPVGGKLGLFPIRTSLGGPQ